MLKLFFIILLFYTSLQANVYFTKEITPSSMVKIFKKLNVTLTGKVGLKVHSGEIGGKYFLHPNFLQEIYDYTQGTFIECNTAYRRGRHTTELHKELLKDHGWLDNDRRTVIMDEDPNADFNLTINNPGVISENIVGAHLKDFDSCIVLSHLKGHGMGGFGGALKQLSIGFASQAGKAWSIQLELVQIGPNYSLIKQLKKNLLLQWEMLLLVLLNILKIKEISPLLM